MATKSDTLQKPDMQAVLSRTHLNHDVHGFLLPVLEAVSNAIHGIESRFGDDAARDGKIEIVISDLNDPSKIMISVEDNGVGLNDENYRSFKTPFSGFKLKQRGRGFGRFIAFKVFSRVHYSSRYEFMGAEKSRTFRFDIREADEIVFHDGDPDFTGAGLRVELNNPLTDWHDLVRVLDRDEIADLIGSHFLPLFLYKWLPEITIKIDQDEAHSIREHFREIFVQYDKGTFQCEIDGRLETLEYSLARLPKTRIFKSHCLLLSAGDRIVGNPRDLSTKLGQTHFKDSENNKYIIIAVVKGDAFENRLNDARTGINLPAKAVENIVSEVSNVIEVGESEQIERIKTDQSDRLAAALRENPILRIGLRGKGLNDYVRQKPNHWKTEEFISDLAIERSRASRDLNKAISAAASDPDNYAETIKAAIDKIDEVNKEALAEYVIHRKNVIELIEAARKYGDDGKHPPEDVIHDLIFKRFADSVSTEYFDHNLWVIDDLLAFLPYVSSDRTMHGGRRRKGDKIADLVFFDDSLVLGDSDGTTLTIVEFKKPSRDDYKIDNEKTDPVRQVLSTLNKAVAQGSISKTDGTHFDLSSVVRRNAFIIADLTPSLRTVLIEHDFRNQANPKIFHRYYGNQGVFVQAFGYDTLVENAKKRNQAFFSVLFGE